MIDPGRLTKLMVACDFAWPELKRIAEDYLGLAQPNATSIMPDGDIERRCADLVAWADRQGMLNELLKATLIEGNGKRAVRELVLGGREDDADMSEMPTNYSNLEKWMERLDQRLLYVERELQWLKAAVQARATGGVPALNWNIIVVAIIVAIFTGLAVYLTGRLT